MQRTYAKEVIPTLDGKTVLLDGWVSELRDMAKVKFILLRDKTGIIQLVAPAKETKPELFKEIAKIPIESVIEVTGKVKKSKFAKAGVEVVIKDLKVLSKAETLPITVSEKGITIDLSKRLDYRSIDLRKPKVHAIFNIQSEIAMAFRNFFKDHKFIEIEPPEIIATATEGGTDLFPVQYFEKKAYLAQSPQLYKQMFAISVEDVFTIIPVWRAEKHNTPRHLNESRQMDIEMAFADEFKVMGWLTKAVQYIVKTVKENCKEDLEILGLKLDVPGEVYLTYEDALKLLEKNGIKIKYGEDLTPEAEKKLCKLNPKKIVYVHDWPLSLKPFYIMPKDKKISRGFDALYGGIEISSGGQRVHIPDILTKQLKERGLDPKKFKYYIDCFRYGSPAHAGWSIGLERLTMVLCELENIREACLFPRDRGRLTP